MNEAVALWHRIYYTLQHCHFLFGVEWLGFLDAVNVEVDGTWENRIVGVNAVDGAQCLDVSIHQTLTLAWVSLKHLAQCGALDGLIDHALASLTTIDSVERDCRRNAEHECCLRLLFLFDHLCVGGRVVIDFHYLFGRYTIYGTCTACTEQLTLAEVYLAQFLLNVDDFRKTSHFEDVIDFQIGIDDAQSLVHLREFQNNTQTA